MRVKTSCLYTRQSVHQTASGKLSSWNPASIIHILLKCWEYGDGLTRIIGNPNFLICLCLSKPLFGLCHANQVALVAAELLLNTSTVHIFDILCLPSLHSKRTSRMQIPLAFINYSSETSFGNSLILVHNVGFIRSKQGGSATTTKLTGCQLLHQWHPFARDPLQLEHQPACSGVGLDILSDGLIQEILHCG